MKPGESVVVSEIHMIDASNGWAIGGPTSLDQTHVLRTSDGGLTWDDVTPPEPLAAERRPARAFFLDSGLAWVTLERPSSLNPPLALAMWHTQDRGDSWTQSPPLPPQLTDAVPPSSLQFVDPDFGWMVVGDAHPSLLTTENAGFDWSPVEFKRQSSPKIMTLCDRDARVVFLDRTNGWLLRRCDDPSLPELYRPASVDTVWNHIWSEIPLPPPQAQLTPDHPSVSCQDEAPILFSPGIGTLAFTCHDDAGWKGGLLYRTQDDGQSWEIFPYPGGSLQFLDENIGWALGRDIYKTADGGEAWTKVKTVNWDGQFSFVDEQNGWAVARSGDEISLVRTEDGGRTWKEVRPTVAYADAVFRSLSMIDATHGWAIVDMGAAARVFSTLDGGMTWEDVTPDGLLARTGDEIVSGVFVNARTGWLLVHELPGPDDGTLRPLGIWHTTDGGRTWSVDHGRFEGAGRLFFAFADDQNGWFGMEEGDCAMGVGCPMDTHLTNDGGAAWRPADITLNANSLTGFDPLDGARALIAEHDTAVDSPSIDLIAAGNQVLPGWTGNFPAPAIHQDYDFYELHTEMGLWCDILDPHIFTGSSAAVELVCDDPTRLHAQAWVYRTQDAGKTWASFPLPNPAIGEPSSEYARRHFSIQFLTPLLGWVSIQDEYLCGEDCWRFETVLHQTLDGGKSWGEGIHFDGEVDLQFVNQHHAWVLLRAGAIVASAPETMSLLKTSDGGRTWKELHPVLAH
jgi:photosystem II stability/assembly factor-like uncharacterized protein